jgi:hypothetical protein
LPGLKTLLAKKMDLLAAKIDVAPGTGPTVRDPPLIRHRFMRGLGTGRASALDA